MSDAYQIAIDYERRVPGPEAWSYMGRALWRLGALTAAEAFHRRAARDGHPEGRLGVARALAARGDFAAAAELAAPTVDVEEMTVRAGRFLGGLYWQLGDPAAAAAAFARASGAATDEMAVQLAALGTAVLAAAGVTPRRWEGAAATATTEQVDGTTWLDAQIAGEPARLRLDPLASRSSVTPQFVARLGLDAGTRHLALRMALGDVAATVPLAVRELEFGDGVLSFDLLADLRWIWSPASGAFFVGPDDNRAAARGFQRDLAFTHWVTARSVVDGLGLQLLLVPRLGARPAVATATTRGIGTISPRAAETASGAAVAVGDEVLLRTRVGGWDAELAFRVVHEMGAVSETPLAPPVVLGADFAERWDWRWSPTSRQLGLIDRAARGSHRP